MIHHPLHPPLTHPFLLLLLLLQALPAALACSACSNPAALPQYPRLSDARFSSRWAHPQNAHDPHNTWTAASGFDATHLDWIYTLDPTVLGTAQQHNLSLSVAMNGVLPDRPSGNRTFAVGRALRLDGSPVVLPWMTWKPTPHPGCVNNPAYRQIAFSFATGILDVGRAAGAQHLAIQHDDALMNSEVYMHQGCYCSYCMSKYTQYLLQTQPAAKLQALNVTAAFNYKQYLLSDQPRHNTTTNTTLRVLFSSFQNASTRLYFQDLRSTLNSHANRTVLLSMNNGGRWGADTPYDLADWGMGELFPSHCHQSPDEQIDPACLVGFFEGAYAANRTQILTAPKHPNFTGPWYRAVARQALGLISAAGGLMLAPWDVYVSGSSPRIFTDPADYVDLYRFLRAHSALLDNFTNATALAAPFTPGASPVQVTNSTGGNSSVIPLVRTNGTSFAVHLVAYGGPAVSPTPTNLAVQLDPHFFTSPHPPSALLHLPGQAVGPLPVQCSASLRCTLPAPLDPWGILSLVF